MHDPHQAPQRQGRQTTFTILTAIESTIGLGLAVLTSKKGYTPHQAAQLHHWIVKYGFTKVYYNQTTKHLWCSWWVQLLLTSNFLPGSVHPTHIRVKGRWNVSIATSLTNFVQRDFSGAETSTSNHTCCLQSLYPGHYITASSSWTTTSCTHQGRPLTSRTTATTTALTSCTLERLVWETSGTSRHRSYVSGTNIRNFVASGSAETSSRMSTSLHYLCTTVSIHLQHLLEHTGAGRSLVYLVKNNTTSSSWRASTGLSSVMTSTSTSRSTSTTFRSRTSRQGIYNCNNHHAEKEDIEQPQGVQPPALRHHPQAAAPPQEQQPQVLQPPPGLPQPPLLQPPRQVMVKQQALSLPVPPLQGPPPEVQAAPVPQAPPAVHRPAGKHYNPPRGPPPKAANIHWSSSWRWTSRTSWWEPRWHLGEQWHTSSSHQHRQEGATTSGRPHQEDCRTSGLLWRWPQSVHRRWHQGSHRIWTS